MKSHKWEWEAGKWLCTKCSEVGKDQSWYGVCSGTREFQTVAGAPVGGATHSSVAACGGEETAEATAETATPPRPPKYGGILSLAPAGDSVERPVHYTKGEIECIDAIEAAITGLSAKEGFLVGQVIKYIWRFKHKGGREDLKKCEWYLKRLMEYDVSL